MNTSVYQLPTSDVGHIPNITQQKGCIELLLDLSPDPSCLSAAADSTTALVTIGVLITAWYQLSNSNRQQRVWTTLQACNQYDSDPVISSAARDFYNFCEGKTPYLDEMRLENATRTLFNYFEAICIGMYQNLYDPEIVYEHLGAIMVSRRRALFNSKNPVLANYSECMSEYHQEYLRASFRFQIHKPRLKFLGLKI